MPDLSSNSQTRLLRIARESIQTFLQGKPWEPSDDDLKMLGMTYGCFVTLRIKKQLRGCVGTFEQSQPLWRNVYKMARQAAFKDSRFPEVTAEELPELRIEISVLFHFKHIKSSSEIQIGRHGIWIQCNGKSGTFLPEVALEQGWDAEALMHYCAKEKARLSAEEIPQAELLTYEVLKIAERR